MTWQRDTPPRQRDIVSIRPGGSLSNYSPSFFIQSIHIDNPSGSWLFVETLHQWVPPYTLGWQRNLDWQTRAITITAPTVGPSGARSTTAGDDVVVTLSDGHILVPTVGLAYGVGTTPTILSSLASQATTYVARDDGFGGQLTYTLVALGLSTTTKLRIFRLGISGDDTPGTPAVNGRIRLVNDVTMRVTSFAFTGAGQLYAMELARFWISPNKQVDETWYDGGMDLQPGQPVSLNFIIPIVVNPPTGVTQSFNFNMTYAVI